MAWTTLIAQGTLRLSGGGFDTDAFPSAHKGVGMDGRLLFEIGGHAKKLDVQAEYFLMLIRS